MGAKRFKNHTWTARTDSQGNTITEHAQLMVLQDIRDELQALNRLLGCYRVIEGMDALRRIDKRLKKTHPLR